MAQPVSTRSLSPPVEDLSLDNEYPAIQSAAAKNDDHPFRNTLTRIERPQVSLWMFIRGFDGLAGNLSLILRVGKDSTLPTADWLDSPA